MDCEYHNGTYIWFFDTYFIPKNWNINLPYILELYKDEKVPFTYTLVPLGKNLPWPYIPDIPGMSHASTSSNLH